MPLTQWKLGKEPGDDERVDDDVAQAADVGIFGGFEVDVQVGDEDMGAPVAAEDLDGGDVEEAGDVGEDVDLKGRERPTPVSLPWLFMYLWEEYHRS